jgi:hypothetical protein
VDCAIAPVEISAAAAAVISNNFLISSSSPLNADAAKTLGY